jgi:hypothetical protein
MQGFVEGHIESRIDIVEGAGSMLMLAKNSSTIDIMEEYVKVM